MPSAIGYYNSRNGFGATSDAQTRPIPPDGSVHRLEEKVRAAAYAGRVNFMPYFDPYTEETWAMRRMYPIMLRSGVVKQALQTKVNSVASLDLQVHPANDTPRDEEVADFIRYAYIDALDGGFPALCDEMLYPALITKSSVCEMVWYQDLWERGKHKGKRFLRQLKAKEYAQLVQDQYRNVVGVRAVGFGQAEMFSPEDFAIFINFRLFQGVGMSDLRAAYQSLWQLDTVEKMHGIHLDKYLTPVVHASYGEGFDVSTLPTVETDLTAIKARGYFLGPESLKVQCLQMAVRGEAEFLEYCKDRREQIVLSIAGAYLQMLTTGGGGGEMRGSAQTQKSTAELLVWALASRVEAIINSQITPRLIAENYQGVDWPKVSLGGINYEELRGAIEIDFKAQQMGANLSTKAFVKKYGVQVTTDPNDVMTPGGQQPQPGMSGMFDEGRRSFQQAPPRG